MGLPSTSKRSGARWRWAGSGLDQQGTCLSSRAASLRGRGGPAAQGEQDPVPHVGTTQVGPRSLLCGTRQRSGPLVRGQQRAEDQWQGYQPRCLAGLCSSFANAAGRLNRGRGGPGVPHEDSVNSVRDRVQITFTLSTARTRVRGGPEGGLGAPLRVIGPVGQKGMALRARKAWDRQGRRPQAW